MELIHVLNRGVDKRDIFLDDQDYFRAILDIYEFNNQDHANTVLYSFNISSLDVGRPKIPKVAKQRKVLVDILAFCLVPNHYHMLLSPRVENGVTLFMKKFNGGYAKYFNERYHRTGALFQGKYKRIILKNEAHFIHLPYYIHFNPLDLIMPEWRDGKLRNYEKAIHFLEEYRWSSHLDYAGIKNFPSITNRKLLTDFFNRQNGYKKSIKGWLRELDIGEEQRFILE